eukprot:m.221110 g.221110  ORF g.221110 m.221110 type:complete len:93 (+) comp17244_c0_seq4:229-507(+)
MQNYFLERKVRTNLKSAIRSRARLTSAILSSCASSATWLAHTKTTESDLPTFDVLGDTFQLGFKQIKVIHLYMKGWGSLHANVARWTVNDTK